MIRRLHAYLRADASPWTQTFTAAVYLLCAVIALGLDHPLIAVIAAFAAGLAAAGPVDHLGKLWKARHDRR